MFALLSSPFGQKLSLGGLNCYNLEGVIGANTFNPRIDSNKIYDNSYSGYPAAGGINIWNLYPPGVIGPEPCYARIGSGTVIINKDLGERLQ